MKAHKNSRELVRDCLLVKRLSRYSTSRTVSYTNGTLSDHGSLMSLIAVSLMALMVGSLVAVSYGSYICLTCCYLLSLIAILLMSPMPHWLIELQNALTGFTALLQAPLSSRFLYVHLIDNWAECEL